MHFAAWKNWRAFDRFENSLISKHKQIAKHVAIDGWLCYCNAATMPKFLFQVYEVLAEL